MEKLIELLNEYEQEEGCRRLKYGKLHNKYYDDYDRKDEEIRLISKWYGFIKWLVENDKIDKEFEDNKMLGDIFDSGYRFNDDYMEERLLCYLTLSDNPIEFLISILK